MIKTFNHTIFNAVELAHEEFEYFKSHGDIRSFTKAHGLDGIELQIIDPADEDFLELDIIKGIHLSFFNCFMDFWLGDEERLAKEYGSLAVAHQFYGGTTKAAIIDKFTKELERAERAGVQYVVFHVSEVTIEECYTRQYTYSDAQVIDAACEIINQLLVGKDYHFDFLMENLWWPGFNFLDPRMTKRLLDGIHYEHKGLMIDTGHLMNTNPDLRTQAEAVVYINTILDKHEELIPWIKGIHLNASLSGQYVQEEQVIPATFDKDYKEKRQETFGHIFKLDQHRPFVDEGRHQIVKRIDPKYLTHELITNNREELVDYLHQQKHNDGGVPTNDIKERICESYVLVK